MRWGITVINNESKPIVGKGNGFFQIERINNRVIYDLKESASRSGYYYTDSVPISTNYNFLVNGIKHKELSGDNGIYILLIT